MNSVWDRVASLAERHPERPAVRGDETLTYRELVGEVRSLAAGMATYAHRDSPVGIEVRQSRAAIVAVLATFASAMAAVPIDPDMPAVRVDLMMQDARPAMIVREDADGRLTVHEGSKCPVDLPAGTAYVMYTSGSTGRPKGVIVSQHALLDRLDGLAAVPGLRAGESMLAMTALTFDIAMAEILLPLVVGGTVICGDPMARLDPTVFLEDLDEAPDVLQATPSFWKLALASGWQGAPKSRIWCGGEALTPALAENLLPTCAELWNLYGPTEATIWATAEHVADASEIGLGEPLAGCAVHLIEQDTATAVRPGEVGEIVLSGSGIATGYLGRADQTAAKFGPIHGIPAPSYRTGDLARRRANGSMEFLGRVDNQIKIRGHRIETGEIEALLEQHPDVVEAAVLPRHQGDPMRAHVEAYVVSAVSGADLRRWLAEKLPAIMVPGKIHPVTALPRTSAGKIDRVRLMQRS